MESSLARILERVSQAEHVTVDPVVGGDGVWGLAMVIGDSYFFYPKNDQEEWELLLQALTYRRLVTYDVRKIVTWPLSPGNPVYDVKLLWGGDRSLGKLVRERYPTVDGLYGEFNQLEQKMLAHARAAKTAKLGHLPATEVVPKEVLVAWVKARVAVIENLYKSSQVSSGPDGFNRREIETRWPFILALRESERAGIHVDMEAIDRLLAEATGANAAALRSLQGQARDGFVNTLFNPIGTKTGRLKVEAGFNAHGIPDDTCRKAITSRFEGGSIYTFDFNAIDYRCMVRSVGGEFAKLYDGVDDFHERTTKFLFDQPNSLRRKIIKTISYAYIYGGSVDTIIETTGLKKEYIDAALKKLDENIRPLADFRERLYQDGQRDKFIDTPGGRRVYVYPDDHPGKVLGLYAQTYSSWVFEQAFTVVHQYLKWLRTSSTIIFSVHDELVVDMRPENEKELPDRIRGLMEQAGGGGWKVRVKKGGSYGEQTERRADPEEQGTGGEADRQAPLSPQRADAGDVR